MEKKLFFIIKVIIIIPIYYKNLDSLILTCWYYKRLAILLSNFHDNRF